MGNKEDDSKSKTMLRAAIITGIFALCGTVITVIGGPIVEQWLQNSSTFTQIIGSSPSNDDTSKPIVPGTGNDQESSTQKPILALGTIPFSLPKSPDLLNPTLKWEQGGASGSTYNIDPSSNSVEIIAGPNTDQWIDRDTTPTLYLPIFGDFETQVRVEFSPEKNTQFAELGVRSRREENTWIRVGRGYIFDKHAVGFTVMDDGWSKATNGRPNFEKFGYFKIEKRGTTFKLSHSSDGTHWTPFTNEAGEEDLVLEMPEDDMEIFLQVWSTGEEAISARFYEFIVISE